LVGKLDRVWQDHVGETESAVSTETESIASTGTAEITT
jgi:hypothetical protein